ncbi:putative pG1 protein, partial [Staphylococcus aureus]
MPPTYYRGCWHVVSRGFLIRYRQDVHSYLHICSSLITEFYDPKTFITHAALLRQAFAHCGRSLLLPPVGVWTVSQFQCADHPLRSAMHRCLGK